MKNEYKKSYDGNDVLVLNYDGSTTAAITVSGNDIVIFKYDYDESNYNSIPIEDWKEFKAFIDNQISLKGK